MRRINRDVKELKRSASPLFTARPCEDDMRRWFFTIRGPCGTDFDGGIYHGMILLPSDYPYRPPNIIWLTPNGRFKVNTKICLSISAHHPEEWQPAWGVRTILEALVSFMPSPGNGAIGSLDWTPKERQRLAKKSRLSRVELPDAYAAHVDSWLSKCPIITEEMTKEARSEFNDEAKQVLRFHEPSKTNAPSPAAAATSAEAKSTPSGSNDESRSEVRRRKNRTTPNNAVKDSPNTNNISNSPQRAPAERPNIVADCLGFLVIALVFVVGFTLASKLIKF